MTVEPTKHIIKGNILLVGIDYDKDAKKTDTEFKHHKCKIEQA